MSDMIWENPRRQRRARINEPLTPPPPPQVTPATPGTALRLAEEIAERLAEENRIASALAAAGGITGLNLLARMFAGIPVGGVKGLALRGLGAGLGEAVIPGAGLPIGLGELGFRAGRHLLRGRPPTPPIAPRPKVPRLTDAAAEAKAREAFRLGGQKVPAGVSKKWLAGIGRQIAGGAGFIHPGLMGLLAPIAVGHELGRAGVGAAEAALQHRLAEAERFEAEEMANLMRLRALQAAELTGVVDPLMLERERHDAGIMGLINQIQQP